MYQRIQFVFVWTSNRIYAGNYDLHCAYQTFGGRTFVTGYLLQAIDGLESVIDW